MKEKFDLIVIGAGPGGYVAAVRAGELGLKVLCIDERKEPGGTCLHVGCIPSKALLQSTAFFSHIQKESEMHGVSVTGLEVDFHKMQQRKEEVVSSLAKGVSFLFSQHKVSYLQGKARFISETCVEVQTEEGKKEIEAFHFLIATGSLPIPFPGVPFDEKVILSSTGALFLEKAPEKMAVIGGGIIGVQIASVYRRLGSEILIIEMLDHICPGIDHELQKLTYNVLEKQGIQFQLSTKVTSLIAKERNCEIVIHDQKKEFDVALISIGRKPNTKELSLEKIGVETTKEGFIQVNPYFQTSKKNIFAIGDVLYGSMLAHKASIEAIACIEFLAGASKPVVDYMTVPNIVYTEPEIASVGFTEKELTQLKIDFIIGKSFFKHNPRALCAGENVGLVKVLADKKTKRLLGVHIIGREASELIEIPNLLLLKKGTLNDLAYLPVGHPTLSETIKEAAMNALNSV